MVTSSRRTNAHRGRIAVATPGRAAERADQAPHVPEVRRRQHQGAARAQQAAALREERGERADVLDQLAQQDQVEAPGTEGEAALDVAAHQVGLGQHAPRRGEGNAGDVGAHGDHPARVEVAQAGRGPAAEVEHARIGRQPDTREAQHPVVLPADFRVGFGDLALEVSRLEIRSHLCPGPPWRRVSPRLYHAAAAGTTVAGPAR